MLALRFIVVICGDGCCRSGGWELVGGKSCQRNSAAGETRTGPCKVAVLGVLLVNNLCLQ